MSAAPADLNNAISQAAVVQESMVASQAEYHYPFASPLRHALERQGARSILLFSFGSLMNEKSAALTLSPEALETRRPAIAFGIKRLYNYDPESTSRGEPPNPLERGMLNTVYTGNPHDYINGVLIDMPATDAVALSNREVGYDLIPVLVANWEETDSPQFQIAYTLRAKETATHNNHRLVKADIYPRADYHQLVLEGAQSFGDRFAEVYLRTTYLADGERPLCTWTTC